MDKIIIDSLRIFAYHGVNPEEQEDGQFFILDIEADMPLSKAGESDDIDDTVSYAQMIKCARRVFTAQKDRLIERCRRTARGIPAPFGRKSDLQKAGRADEGGFRFCRGQHLQGKTVKKYRTGKIYQSKGLVILWPTVCRQL